MAVQHDERDRIPVLGGIGGGPGPGPSLGGDLDGLTPAQAQRVQTLQVIVKEETPFLPRVAFTLITVASLAGAIFTGHGMGLTAPELPLRWLSLWTTALAGGLLAWRLIYLRTVEVGLDRAKVDALNETALRRADRVGKVLAPLVVLGAVGPLVSGYLDVQPGLRWSLAAGALVLAALLALGVSRTVTAAPALMVSALVLVGWAYGDAGSGWRGGVRLLHLTAFTLWLGGALWNIAVAMPAGRAHPTVDAVLAGARQLDRFRWVVRFALPTIIVTGLVMADAYRALPLQWWLHLPGLLIPFKVLLIIALVAVFIACPLFRQCSPVQGVCNIDDLVPDAGKPGGERP
jgi:putative copper resistance protein D